MSGREPSLTDMLGTLPAQFGAASAGEQIKPLRIEAVPAESKIRPIGGTQHCFKFPNGYGASVVQGPGSYGSDSGLWELAVLHDDELTYDTPITSDVIGWLTDDDVAGLLILIADLPAKVRP